MKQFNRILDAFKTSLNLRFAYFCDISSFLCIIDDYPSLITVGEVTFIIRAQTWKLSKGTGIMTMLSPSNNLKYTTMNPPVEYWKTMEKMQRNWLQYGIYQMPNFTAFTPPPPPLFPAEYPEPGAVASEFTYGVSWLNVPLGFIQVLVSGLGLYGVYEENDPKYLFPFIAWSVINPIIFFLMGLLTPMGFMFATFAMSVLQLAIYVYFVIVVCSYYANTKGKLKYHPKTTSYA